MATKTQRSESAQESKEFQTDNNQKQPQLLTIGEMADILHVPKSWIYQQTRMGPGVSIPFMKVGKYLRFEAWEVINFFKTQGNCV